jgi:hypothetical protein
MILNIILANADKKFKGDDLLFKDNDHHPCLYFAPILFKTPSEFLVASAYSLHCHQWRR